MIRMTLRRFLGLTCALGTVLLAAGCSPTVSVAEMNPMAQWQASRTSPRNQLMFAASTRKTDSSGAVTGEVLSQTRYFLTSVSVPPGHKPGVIERASFGSDNPASHFMLGVNRPLDEASFKIQVAAQLSGRVGVARDILVFVHGFNTSYDEARLRLAQVVTDSNFTGVPLVFTWPSRSAMLQYVSDKESATASRDNLERLLRDLAAVPGVGRVHVLAHSMGTWLAMEALRQNAIAGHADLDGHIGEVMLASPDIDLDVFRNQMARLGHVTRVSVFAANDDRALSISSTLAGSRTRLGTLDLSNTQQREEIGRLGVRVYDLSNLDVSDMLRHGNYAEAPLVVQTIGAQLAEPKTQDAQATGYVDPETVKAANTPTPVAPGPTGLPPIPVGNLGD
jgi:esterase/lipase superfamily enzyme